MNRERAKELLPIIQAFAEGKTVQWKDNFQEWQSYDPNTGASVNFDGKHDDQWRIKPEPRVFWLDTAHGTFTNYDPQIKGHVRVIEDLSDD